MMFPWVPGGLDDFVDRVVPELQRRKPLPPRIRGPDPRENLGLPRPENRFSRSAGFNPEHRPFAPRAKWFWPRCGVGICTVRVGAASSLLCCCGSADAFAPKAGIPRLDFCEPPT